MFCRSSSALRFPSARRQLFATASAAAASAKPSATTEAVQQKISRLPNGLCVSSVDFQGPMSQLVFAFRSGARYEQHDEAGLTHQLRNTISNDPDNAISNDSDNYCSSNFCDSLAFKRSIVSVNSATLSLATISLHSIEDDFLRDGYTDENIHQPELRADPEHRCCAFTVYGRHLSVAPFNITDRVPFGGVRLFGANGVRMFSTTAILTNGIASTTNAKPSPTPNTIVGKKQIRRVAEFCEEFGSAAAVTFVLGALLFVLVGLVGMYTKVENVDSKLSAKMDKLSDKMDTKFDKIDGYNLAAEMDKLSDKMDSKFDKMDSKFDKLAAEMLQMKTDVLSLILEKKR